MMASLGKLKRSEKSPFRETHNMKTRVSPQCRKTRVFYLLMKSFLKGKRFKNDESLISEVKAWLQAQPAEFYRRGLQNCIKRWEKCVSLAGAYVEKD